MSKALRVRPGQDGGDKVAMEEMDKRGQVLTIPNLLSAFRILLVPVMVLLYQLLLRWEARPWPALRDVALWIYVIHPGIIVVVRGAAKVLNQTKILVDDNLVHYLVVLLLSFAVSVAAAVLVPIVKDFTVGFLAGLREDGTRRMRGKTDLEARKRT